MARLLGILTFVVALTLTGCGRTTGQPSGEPIHTGTAEGLRLMVFGAFWCDTCSRELPALQRQLKEQLGANFDKLDLELWVPTGETAVERPSQENAELYRQKVGLEAEVHVDEWRWQNFRKLLPGARPALPAGVLTDSEGNVLKRFPPGADSFVPADIVAAVRDHM